jgi:hypothetical protein
MKDVRKVGRFERIFGRADPVKKTDENDHSFAFFSPTQIPKQRFTSLIRMTVVLYLTDRPIAFQTQPSVPQASPSSTSISGDIPFA